MRVSAGSAGSVDLLLGRDYREARLGLSMPTESLAESVQLEVIDLEAQGRVVSSFPLPLALDKPWSLIPNGKQALLLRRHAAQQRPLLDSLSEVRGLRFHVETEVRKQRSLLLDGGIRFPDGELEPIKLERGFLLAVEPRDGFSLRSLGLRAEGYGLTLWGEPQSLRVGPSQGYLRQLLPSWLVWIHHRWTKLLLGGMVIGVLSAALTLFKLFKP